MVAEVYRALVEAGAPETSARAAAAAIPVAGDMVVKEDLWALKEELLARIAQVEHGLGERIEQVEHGLGERIAQQGERMGRLERDMAVLKFAYGPIIILLLLKIAFLP